MVTTADAAPVPMPPGTMAKDELARRQQHPSSSAAAAAVTLSFGGVDFRLTASDVVAAEDARGAVVEAAPLVSIAGMGKESIVLRLSSFTGTLRVAPSSWNLVHSNTSDVVATTTPAAATTTTATPVEEDDPPSPPTAQSFADGATKRKATPSPPGGCVGTADAPSANNRNNNNHAERRTVVDNVERPTPRPPPPVQQHRRRGGQQTLPFASKKKKAMATTSGDRSTAATVVPPSTGARSLKRRASDEVEATASAPTATAPRRTTRARLAAARVKDQPASSRRGGSAAMDDERLGGGIEVQQQQQPQPPPPITPIPFRLTNRHPPQQPALPAQQSMSAAEDASHQSDSGSTSFGCADEDVDADSFRHDHDDGGGGFDDGSSSSMDGGKETTSGTDAASEASPIDALKGSSRESSFLAADGDSSIMNGNDGVDANVSRSNHDDDSVASFHSGSGSVGNDKTGTKNGIVELDQSLTAEYDDMDDDDGGDDHQSSFAFAAMAPRSASTTKTMTTTTNRSTAHPRPRWGQTMTMIDHSRVIVYGGQTVDAATGGVAAPLTDLHVYDLQKRSWTKPVNCEGVARTWHTATFLPERQLLISFGGDTVNPKTGRTVTTDQVMVLDTEIMLWYPPSVSGTVPTGRSGHTASLLPNTNELVVFGGVKNGKWQNSVAVLDTTLWKWTVPKISGNAPRPRSYHTATAVVGCSTGDGVSTEHGGTSTDGSGGGRSSAGGSTTTSRLVIFGGNDDSSSFDTVHVLDATEGKWSWYHPIVSGTPPSARTGHCAVLLEDNKTILVYGGWDPTADDDDAMNDEEAIFQDCFLLDTELWTWSKGPKPKYFSGGTGSAPNAGPKRVGHSAVLAPGEEGAQVLVFGGRIPNDEFACDFQTLVVPQSMVGLGGYELRKDRA